MQIKCKNSTNHILMRNQVVTAMEGMEDIRRSGTTTKRGEHEVTRKCQPKRERLLTDTPRFDLKELLRKLDRDKMQMQLFTQNLNTEKIAADECHDDDMGVLGKSKSTTKRSKNVIASSTMTSKMMEDIRREKDALKREKERFIKQRALLENEMEDKHRKFIEKFERSQRTNRREKKLESVRQESIRLETKRMSDELESICIELERKVKDTEQTKKKLEDEREELQRQKDQVEAEREELKRQKHQSQIERDEMTAESEQMRIHADKLEKEQKAVISEKVALARTQEEMIVESQKMAEERKQIKRDRQKLVREQEQVPAHVVAYYQNSKTRASEHQITSASSTSPRWLGYPIL